MRSFCILVSAAGVAAGFGAAVAVGFAAGVAAAGCVGLETSVGVGVAALEQAPKRIMVAIKKSKAMLRKRLRLACA